MPAANYMTPNMLRAKELAMMALSSSQGIRLEYISEKVGGWKEARRRAKSLSIAFHAMRSREHRKAQGKSQQEHKFQKDSDIVAPFDRVACVMQELPEGQGFTVSMMHVRVINWDDCITDRATGLPIHTKTPDEKRCENIAEFFLSELFRQGDRREKLRDPLTDEDRAFWFHFQPALARDYYETCQLPVPGESVATVEVSTDLADIPLDVNPFDMPEGVDNEGEGE